MILVWSWHKILNQKVYGCNQSRRSAPDRIQSAIEICYQSIARAVAGERADPMIELHEFGTNTGRPLTYPLYDVLSRPVSLHIPIHRILASMCS
jgi:hypothetical protein